MQVAMLTLVGMAVVTFIGVQIYERVVLPRATKRSDQNGKT